jgi:hypothetical protein
MAPTPTVGQLCTFNVAPSDNLSYELVSQSTGSTIVVTFSLPKAIHHKGLSHHSDDRRYSVGRFGKLWVTCVCEDIRQAYRRH